MVVNHLDVEVRSEELPAPVLLCHKEPARASEDPYWGIYHLCHKEPARSKQNILRSKATSRGLWMRRAGFLWHKRAGGATL